MKNLLAALAASLPLLAAQAAAATAAQNSAPMPAKVAERYALGETGGWDYLSFDAAQQRLFVTRGNRVVVIDANSGKTLGTVADTDGVHGVALVPALNKGFTSNGKSNTVTVFDLDTLKVRQKIKLVGETPDTILFDPASRHVFVFNGHSNSIDVLDPVKETLLTSIALSGNPEFAVADGHGRLYVNLESSGALAAIDTRAAKVLATWPLGDCEEPTGLAYDAAHALTFSTCQNRKMVVFDVKRGKPVTALAIDEGPDAAAFDPARGLVYSSNGASGTLSVYHVDDAKHFQLVETVATQKSARTMALDPAGHRVFLAAAEFGPKPEPSTADPKPRAPMLTDSFVILVVR